MYFDGFYNAISRVIVFSGLPIFLALRVFFGRLSFERFLKIRPWISTVVYLCISVLLFGATILKIQYISTYIDIIIFSAAALIYSLVDIFYFQEMKKEYIWNLQNQFIRMGSEKILFERVTLFGSYVETREYRAQECSIVRTENHGFCIYIGGIDRVGLKPKKEMSYFLLQFYAKCFSLKMKKIPIFKECDNLEDIVSNYQFFKPSCIYLFIQKHREIIWKIALGILIFLAAAYLFYIVAASQNWFDIGEWMKQEIA